MSTALIATALPAALVWGAGPEQRVFGAAALGTLFLAATALVAMAVGDRSPRGAFEVVRQWWESDATVRLGAGLGAAGIAVSTVGVFGVSYGLSMGSAEVGLGAATFVVGVYFAWGSDPFAEGASCSKVTAERRRRRMAAALTAVSTLSWVSALRFTPGLDRSPAKLGMLGAAILATLACSTGFVGIAFHGKGFGTKGWGPRRLRRRLVKTGVTLCGGACLVYAGTHLYVAIALSPPVSMRAALIAAAAALAMTAYVSIRNSPEEFIRLMEVAVRWGFYVPQARYGSQPPEPSPEVDLHDSGQRHEVG